VGGVQIQVKNLSASALRIARVVMERGVAAAIVFWFMLASRALEFVAGFALAFGFFPRLAALALPAFLIPATLVSHSFWLPAGTRSFMGQRINFSKNLEICGGLLFIGATATQTALTESQKR
jgi:uncharacterized membrane protein YphA (DoxX/SURF4 family)